MLRTLAIALLLATPAAAQSSRAQSSRTPGEAIVMEKCAPCHAVGRSGASPNPKAPPLREIAAKYRLQDLEEAFAEGIMVGHEATEMPPFEMSPDEIDSLLAYLRTLKR